MNMTGSQTRLSHFSFHVNIYYTTNHIPRYLYKIQNCKKVWQISKAIIIKKNCNTQNTINVGTSNQSIFSTKKINNKKHTHTHTITIFIKLFKSDDKNSNTNMTSQCMTWFKKFNWKYNKNYQDMTERKNPKT